MPRRSSTASLQVDPPAGPAESERRRRCRRMGRDRPAGRSCARRERTRRFATDTAHRQHGDPRCFGSQLQTTAFGQSDLADIAYDTD